MSIFEHDEELHRKSLLEEGMEMGRQKEATKTALKMIEDGNIPMKKIAEYCSLSLEQVKELSEKLQMV